MRIPLAAAIALFISAPAIARPISRPVVAELFTSEGCSSCPPADAKVLALARSRPDLLLLSFHVTYWNYLGWRDPYSLDAATRRQNDYVSLGVTPETFTPALIVDGKRSVVGSDDAAVDQTLQQAAADKETGAAVDVSRGPATSIISIGAGVGTGTVRLVGYDRLHTTPVGRGENGGRTLEEANIVRSMTVLGTWSGQKTRLEAPNPAGEAVAVIVQRANGHIVGAAVAHGPHRDMTARDLP